MLTLVIFILSVAMIKKYKIQIRLILLLFDSILYHCKWSLARYNKPKQLKLKSNLDGEFTR
jgi:hypothetical protein